MLKKILLTLVTTGVLFALFTFASNQSDVISLTKETFSQVEKEKLILVEFFAPWCGHCKALAPEYEKAATALKAENIKLAKVDCTEETELCNAQDVKGYPTLKVFKEGVISEYSGGRNAEAIISFMKKQALPAVSDVTAETLDTFKDSDNIVIVGFFNEESQNEFNTFNKVAEELRNDYVFGQTAQPDALTKAGVKAPTIILYKKFDEGKNTLEGKFSKDELVSFIKTNAIPLLDDIGPDNYNTYIQSGLPLAFIFYEKDEQRSDLKNKLEPVAKEFKGKVNFVLIDAEKYGQHAGNINLKQKWPAFGIQKSEDGHKYPFDQSKEITTQSIREFVNKFVNNELKPSIKSEPIPKENDEPVYVVVGDSFQEVVFNKSRDVLVEFYAPWCGHCKKLAPIYDELGKAYEHVKDKILIAKMDATENDIPPDSSFKVTGFPTIKLFKAGDKQIIDYSGDRTLEDFIKFISDNASNKVEAKTDKPEPTKESAKLEPTVKDEPEPETKPKPKHEEL